jgi:hypothetical protein
MALYTPEKLELEAALVEECGLPYGDYRHEVAAIIRAYAATLRQSADSGRVGDEVVERAASAFMRVRGLGMRRPWETMLESSRESYRPAFRAALESALAAQGQGEGEPVATVHRMGNCVGQLVYCEFGLNADLPHGTKLYTHPTPAASPAGVPDDALDAKRWRHVWENRMVMRDIGNLHWGDVEYPTIEEIDAELAAAQAAPEGDGGEG